MFDIINKLTFIISYPSLSLRKKMNEEFMLEVDTVMKKIDDPNWKLYRNKNGFEIYWMYSNVRIIILLNNY